MAHTLLVSRSCPAVAQSFTLPHRRFPIGKVSRLTRRLEVSQDWQNEILRYAFGLARRKHGVIPLTLEESVKGGFRISPDGSVGRTGRLDIAQYVLPGQSAQLSGIASSMSITGMSSRIG